MTKIFQCFLITIMGIAFLPSTAAAKTYRISNSGVSISFEHINDAIILKDIKRDEGKSLIFASSLDRYAACPLWEIKIEGKKPLFSGEAAIQNVMRYNNTLNFHWIAQNLRIEATVTVRDSSTYWDLSIVALNDEPFNVQSVRFPIIGDFRQENVKLAVPNLWGQEYQSAQTANYEKIYPSGYAAMQFLAYYNEQNGDGLYISATDTSGIQKILKNRQGSEAIPYARYESAIIPERQSQRYWNLPYSMEVRPYRGSWYEAALIYRDLFSKTKKDNAQKDNWLFDVDMFMLGYMPPNPFYTFDNHEMEIEQTMKYLDIETAGLHLYNWHKHSFDDYYPDYFPPRKGFQQFLKRMHRNGVKVVPYINGRLADVRMNERNSSFAANACMEMGEQRLTSQFENNRFYVMCPSTDFWQSTISNVVDRLIDLGIDGIYYDQVGTEQSWRCINPSHPHTADQELFYNMASGNRWAKAINRMIDPRIISITEDNADIYDFDMHLMYNAELTDPEQTFRIIPLYPAVFSGKTLMLSFGFHFIADPPYTHSATLKLALNFLWGSELSRLSPYDINKNKDFRQYLKSLLKARKSIKDYFHYGQMMKPPLVSTTDSIRITELLIMPSRQDVVFSEKPVVASLWKHRERYGLIITNYSNTAASAMVQIQIPRGNYEMRRLSDNRIEQMAVTNAVEMNLNLSRYSVEVYEFTRQ